MNKQHVLRQLQKVADDEPLFLLRGQDALAAPTVLNWVDRAKQVSVPPAKIEEAEFIALEMSRWPDHKIPD